MSEETLDHVTQACMVDKTEEAHLQKDTETIGIQHNFIEVFQH